MDSSGDFGIDRVCKALWGKAEHFMLDSVSYPLLQKRGVTGSSRLWTCCMDIFFFSVAQLLA